jgi:hypothetical protein
MLKAKKEEANNIFMKKEVDNRIQQNRKSILLEAVKQLKQNGRSTMLDITEEEANKKKLNKRSTILNIIKQEVYNTKCSETEGQQY